MSDNIDFNQYPTVLEQFNKNRKAFIQTTIIERKLPFFGRQVFLVDANSSIFTKLISWIFKKVNIDHELIPDFLRSTRRLNVAPEVREPRSLVDRVTVELETLEEEAEVEEAEEVEEVEEDESEFVDVPAAEENGREIPKEKKKSAQAPLRNDMELYFFLPKNNQTRKTEHEPAREPADHSTTPPEAVVFENVTSEVDFEEEPLPTIPMTFEELVRPDNVTLKQYLQQNAFSVVWNNPELPRPMVVTRLPSVTAQFYSAEPESAPLVIPSQYNPVALQIGGHLYLMPLLVRVAATMLRMLRGS